MDNLEHLDHKDVKLLTALLSTASVEAAAKEAGMGVTTAYAHLKRPAVRDAYLSLKAEALEQASLKLAASATQAVDTLTAIMGNTTAPASSRIGAARTVLEHAYSAHDFEELAAVVEGLDYEPQTP